MMEKFYNYYKQDKVDKIKTSINPGSSPELISVFVFLSLTSVLFCYAEFTLYCVLKPVI